MTTTQLNRNYYSSHEKYTTINRQARFIKQHKTSQLYTVHRTTPASLKTTGMTDKNNTYCRDKRGIESVLRKPEK